MKKQTGFTLIELIVVIVILGILAATALPRFIDLKGDAHRADLDGLAGSLRSAANLAHAAQLAASSAPSDSVTMEGNTVTMVDRYPTADANGIMKAVNLSNHTLISSTGGGAAASAVIGTNSTCMVVYTAANGVSPASVGGRTDTGC